MVKNKKEIEIMTLMFIFFWLVLPLVNATIGLSLDYNDKNSLKVGPGETKEAVIGRFQNSYNESITLKLEISEGADIAELTGDTLTIPAGNLGTPLSIRVSIPQEISEGTKYNVVIKYADMTDKGGSGMITMTQAMTSNFPVLVETPATTEEISLTWWILGIIAVIAIIAIIWFVKNQNK